MFRHLDILHHCAGMKHLVVQRVVRHLEQPLDLKYGIQLLVIHQQELQHLGVVIHLVMQHLGTEVQLPVLGRIDGMRLQKQKEVFFVEHTKISLVYCISKLVHYV